MVSGFVAKEGVTAINKFSLVDGVPKNSVRRWLFSTNHKDIGILYFVTALYFLLVAGMLALAVRTQLSGPDNAFLTGTAFNQAVTVHGLVMVLWFLSPLAFAFANYMVPLQIGARDLAFPRLNALSYWLFLFSGLMLITGFFTPGGAIDTGWTVYAPLSSTSFSPQLGTVLAAAGLMVVVASVTMSTINFIVTIFLHRAPGLKLMRMPMFTWSILFTVILMLLAFPALGAGLLALGADRLLGTVYFSTAGAGPLLWTHLFWFFGHPEVYIVLIPALGAMAEVIPTFSRRSLYGKKFIITALALGVALSHIVWIHHMFLTGIDINLRKFMTITTEIISVPFGVIVLSLIATLLGGIIRFKTPMLFAMGALALFIIGGITGVFNSSVALDYGLRGTYWIVAHFHYTLIGGAVTGMMAAIYYWWPKMTGRMYSEKLGKIHFAIYFVGFNLFAFPLHFLLDMPRRVFTYDPSLLTPNLLASVGAMIFGPSILILFANLIYSLKKGKAASGNPWSTSGVEWMTSSPPPDHDFDGEPIFTSEGRIKIEPSTTLQLNGGGVHAPKTGEAHDGIYASHLSAWPIFISLGVFITIMGLGAYFLGLGLPILLLGLATLVGATVLLAREDLSERFVVHGPRLSERWPFNSGDPPVKVGMWTFLVSEVILFGSLIGAHLFARAQSATWPVAGTILPVESAAIATVILTASGLTATLSLTAIKTGDRIGLTTGLIGTFLLGLGFIILKATDWTTLMAEGFTFSSGLPASTFYVTTGVHGAHVASGLLVLAYLIVKALKGGFTREKHGGVEYFILYWVFIDMVWLFLFPLFFLT